MFWKNFVRLCEQEGKTPNAVAAELGLSSGSVTAWKQGRLPRGGTIEIIAKHFGVDSANLLADNAKSDPTPTDVNQITEKILSAAEILSRTKQGLEQLEAVVSTLQRLAELEQLNAELEASKAKKK